jgi:2-haloacid dehalogenase
MISRDWDLLTFDCYGTLIDWEDGIGRALEAMLAQHGVSASRDELLQRFAEHEARLEHGPYRPYREVLTAVAVAVGDDYGAEIPASDAAGLPASLPAWRPFPDTVEALRRLAAGYRLGILSNVDDDLFAGTAEALGVRFSPVVTAQQVGSYKPADANFERLLAAAEVPRERLLHVAQSLYHDIGPAGRHGITTVWVDRRGAPGGATPSSSASADWVVPDLAALADDLCGG